MSFKQANNYPEYKAKTTDLALKRKEAHNERIRAKRKLLEEARSNGSLNKALISKIYKK
jgi:ribosomal protein L19E